MATHADSFEAFEAARGLGAAAPHHGRKGRTDPYRVRALPNEDIYFHRKAIDNTRVVRQQDPGVRTRCWRRIALAATGTAALAVILWPNVQGTLTGYEIAELKEEQGTLQRKLASLKAEEARLLGPARLQDLAVDLEFTSPDTSQVVFLTPDSEGALALNTPAQ